MITIAIIDDHDLFREGIKLVLQQTEGFKVIFDSPDGNQFIEFLQHTVPDIVLMDISMPAISGVDTTRFALILHPELKIIALTMFSDTLHYMQMIEAGVQGFVLKKASKYELREAVTSVYSGGNYFSREIIRKLVVHSIHLPDPDQLSTRERVILNLVCNGLTSQEISDKLYISVKTVETHRSHIFRKAKVRNASELILWAVKHHIFTIG